MSNENIYQSETWAEAKKVSGKKPVVIRGGSNKLIAFEQILKTPLGTKKIIVSEGMLEAKEEKLAVMLGAFKQISKKYFYGTIMPCLLNFDEKAYRKAGFRKVSNYTILVDLKKSEEELFKNLEKKSARWGVKTGEKNGLKFEQAIKTKDIEEFYKLYNHTADNGGFEPEKIEFLISLANTELSRLFLVKQKGKIVAGGLILIDSANNYSILNLTASSEDGQKLQAMPFLYWNLIKYSKSLGLNYFDLGGYDREAKKGDKTYNINKFKENFGGEVREQPIYATNWKYPFFRWLMKKMRFLKGWYKKEK